MILEQIFGVTYNLPNTPCPATDTTARDDHARRRAIRHATTILVAGSGDGRYGTRRSSRTR